MSEGAPYEKLVKRYLALWVYMYNPVDSVPCGRVILYFVKSDGSRYLFYDTFGNPLRLKRYQFTLVGLVDKDKQLVIDEDDGHLLVADAGVSVDDKKAKWVDWGAFAQSDTGIALGRLLPDSGGWVPGGNIPSVKQNLIDMDGFE